MAYDVHMIQYDVGHMFNMSQNQTKNKTKAHIQNQWFIFGISV